MWAITSKTNLKTMQCSFGIEKLLFAYFWKYECKESTPDPAMVAWLVIAPVNWTEIKSNQTYFYSVAKSSGSFSCACLSNYLLIFVKVESPCNSRESNLIHFHDIILFLFLQKEGICFHISFLFVVCLQTFHYIDYA